MKLSYLRYFQTVCKHCNLSRAAEELFVSQPTLSHAMSDLEDEFNVTLFHRQRNGLTLTEEGKKLLELSTDLTARADALIAEMTSLGESNKTLHLGLPPTIGSIVFPKLFPIMLKNYPDIRMEITEIGSRAALPMISEGQLDAAIISHDGPLPAAFDSIPLRKLSILLYISIENPLASMTEFDFERAKDLPLVLLKEGAFLTSFITKQYHDRKLRPNVILNTNNLHAIRNLLDNDSAATFLFEEALYNNEENIVAIPLPGDPKIQVSLVWNKKQQKSKSLTSMIRLLRSRNQKKQSSDEES